MMIFSTFFETLCSGYKNRKFEPNDRQFRLGRTGASAAANDARQAVAVLAAEAYCESTEASADVFCNRANE